MVTNVTILLSSHIAIHSSFAPSIPQVKHTRFVSDTPLSQYDPCNSLSILCCKYFPCSLPVQHLVVYCPLSLVYVSYVCIVVCPPAIKADEYTYSMRHIHVKEESAHQRLNPFLSKRQILFQAIIAFHQTRRYSIVI